MLTFGSLFAGIGGFDLGLERAGMRCLWQCEIDPYCQRVLEKHWPDVLCVPDIRDLRAGTIPQVDVLAGGFPCQDLSYAGKGAGLDGERSGLWVEYARLIRELRPRYVIVENVSALLSRGLGRVLGDLAACGYDAEWDCIPASAVGAPHRRDRVWLVAYPDGRGEPGVPFDAELGRGLMVPQGGDAAYPNGTRLEGRGRESRVSGATHGQTGGRGIDLADADRAGQEYVPQGDARRGLNGGGAVLDSTVGDRGQPGWPASEWWATEPDVGRVADGVPARVDRLRGLGNALVPQIAEWIGRRIVEYEEGRVAA